MHRVSSLPPDLRDEIGTRNLIVFDGECVLCSGFFRFVLRHDRTARFSFALAQSPFGSRPYRALDLPVDEFETNIVITRGQIHQRGDAFAHAMRALGGPWRAFYPLRFLPRIIKDSIYHLIARNRYRIFGRYDECLVPDDALKARFLPGGWG
ncbi:thiol-disulfide oxidoreductase DCC family protein [Marimonas lutisalis]|uniref:thiol-disulfide oxidoreductase DCC family protein n=1 Tax=Marimonas lutisalis TaxID=2545756 RepID=UPI0010F4D873|nr:DCC1-like thiol-disulfide oxidoreductase family protein [Marimonas lutisalis]